MVASRYSGLLPLSYIELVELWCFCSTHWGDSMQSLRRQVIRCSLWHHYLWRL